MLLWVQENPQDLNHMQRNIVKSGRNSLPLRRPYQLVIQYQMISPESIYASKTNQAEQEYRFRNIFVYSYTYKHVITMNEK